MIVLSQGESGPTEALIRLMSSGYRMTKSLHYTPPKRCPNSYEQSGQIEMLQIHTESIIRSSRIAAQFVIILLIIVLWITKLILITESIVGLVAVLITGLVVVLITELIIEAINSQLSSERLGEPTINGSGSELGEQTTNNPSGATPSLSDSSAMGGANTSIDISTTLPSGYVSQNTTKPPDWYLLKFLLIIFVVVIFAIVLMGMR